MKNQRLRNLTTGKLHTKIDYIYQDIENLTGMKGVMTHMIPNAGEAIIPWLKDKVTDARFFDGKFDVTHLGDYDIKKMNNEERKEFMIRYAALPNPLTGFNIIETKV